MTIKAFVDDIEAVPENLRELYVQDGERYRLDAEGVEDVSGLKSALEREKAERRKAKEALGKVGDIDPDEYQQLKTEAEKRQQQEAERKGEWDKIKAQIVEKHQTELKARDSQVEKMQQALQSHLVDSEATRAISSAKGVPDLLLPHVKARVKVMEEDGKHVVRVVDENGEPRIGSAKGEPMTIAQLVDELKQSDVFGRAFDGTGTSGMGTQPGGRGNGSGAIVLTREQALDPNAYQRAKEQAAKTGQQIQIQR